MSDDTTSDTPPAPEPEAPKQGGKKGRNLAVEQASRRANASTPAPSRDDDEERERDEGDEAIAAATLGGSVLIWNHTHGIRPGVHSEPSRNADGVMLTDGAGQAIWNNVQVHLQPGLNLVDGELWRKVRAGLVDRLRAREIEECYPDMQSRRLLEAISETGVDEVLLAIAEVDDRPKVIEAIEKQRAELSKGGVRRMQARRLQAAHAPRG